MKIVRWVGVPFHVNTATQDRRVLAHGPGDLRPALRRGRSMPLAAPLLVPRMLLRDKPLPLLVQGDPGCFPLRVGAVNAVALDACGARALASGWLDLDELPGLLRLRLVSGNTAHLAPDVDQAEQVPLSVRTLRPFRPWRRTEFTVHHQWRLMGLVIDAGRDLDATWPGCHLRLCESSTRRGRKP